jgi:hypothetical protein
MFNYSGLDSTTKSESSYQRAFSLGVLGPQEKNYSFRPSFIHVFGIPLLIALVTESFQAIKAALTNPATALRSE